MKIIKYVEIENFKTFGDKVHIDLGHPAVLIGPNNAGKTSVIQALALWSGGVKAWFEKKVRPRKEKLERISAGINRLNILEIPVSETRFLWKGTRVRKGNAPIQLVINVGIEHEGKTRDCRLYFTQRDSEVIYCRPCPETLKDDELLSYASKLRFNLLYPMSGIEIDEPLIQEGRINVLMGQGQTAQVLRNLCYKVLENENGQMDWNVIVALMGKLFSVKLGKPELDKNRGTIELHYEQSDIDSKLDIALAGRGLQQMLLVLSYLYSHKGSILLIDEPDAHLEILRQKQVYAILKDIAQNNKCQVIIATHSEVILDDAVDTNLTLLINGEAVNLASQQDIKSALRTYGIEHYYKAKVMPRLLYVDGSTDIEMLRALAKKLEHSAYDVLYGKINHYYTQNDYPEDSLDNQLDRIGGAFEKYRKHFSTLSHYVKNLKGIAIFDSDGKEIPDDIQDNLAIVYWKNYELENYFITPEVILNYIDSLYLHEKDASLFKQQQHEGMERIINQWLLSKRFDGDEGQLAEFLKASKKFQQTVLKNVKMSSFAEQVFEKYAQESQQPILLNKGEFYQLVQHVNKDDISQEVIEKLDLIVKYLQMNEQN